MKCNQSFIKVEPGMLGDREIVPPDKFAILPVKQFYAPVSNGGLISCKLSIFRNSFVFFVAFIIVYIELMVSKDKRFSF